MDIPNINILLADDDKDDCLFFEEALEELPMQTVLTLVHDGEKLMQLLKVNSCENFDVLFLDLNMPRKNGLVCVEEIRNNDKLTALPIIILSTSYDKTVGEQLYRRGVKHYICKPADFSDLKQKIHMALLLIIQKSSGQSFKENFFL